MFASACGLQQSAAAQSSSWNSRRRFVAAEPFNARNEATPQSLHGATVPSGLVQLP